MPRKIGFGLTSLLFLLVCSLPVPAQQFSAVLVHQKPAGAVPTQVSVRGDKIRFEAGKAPQTSIEVIDLKQQTGFLALPAGQTYTVLAPGLIRTPIPFFRPADPENACPSWEKLVGKPGTCTKIGDGTLNGRAAVKYKGVAQNGDTGTAWVDRKLNFVVKWEGQTGAAEFQDIREAPQALALFEAPKGYDKVDPQAERQASKEKARQKQSGARKPQN